MKLVRRGHPIPRALHANMFLVRSARDVMDRNYLLVDEATTFDEFLGLAAGSTGICHVVVTRRNLIVGVLRVNTNLRQTVGAAAGGARMGVLAQRNFTIVRPGEVVFDVIARLWRRGAVMGVVAEGPRRPRAENVVGVITKEHIADEVASSVRMYPR
jgi:CIC family chloride channel protein